jgi:hypothetical protein
MDAIVLRQWTTLSEMNGAGSFVCVTRRPVNVHLSNGQTDPEIRSILACISLVDLNPAIEVP